MAGTSKAATVKVKVREGWAVFDGSAQRGGCHTLDVDPDTAADWIAAGWVEQVNKSTGSKR